MLNPEGVRERDALERLRTSLRHQPPRLPELPWSPVLRRAVAHDPDERYPTAAAFSRAIEDVTRRLGPAEGKSPYPGLASFTEAEAEYFFGREAEVESVWRKLAGPARLSGDRSIGRGKSRFFERDHPAKTRGGGLIATPEIDRSRRSQCSGADLAGRWAMPASHRIDENEVRGFSFFLSAFLLTGGEAPRDGALLIVDQFGSCSDQSPENKVFQGSRPAAVDVRSTFFVPARRLFDSLPPLRSSRLPFELNSSVAPKGRLVAAPSCSRRESGYRFEDESHIGRSSKISRGGALPLAAFRLARSGRKRVPRKGSAYRPLREIGGVAGALAQHAEARSSGSVSSARLSYDEC